MTFCKILKAGKTAGGYDVEAVEYTNKFSDFTSYSVNVAEEGRCIYSATCARTTWRRKYNELQADF